MADFDFHDTHDSGRRVGKSVGKFSKNRPKNPLYRGKWRRGELNPCGNCDDLASLRTKVFSFA